MKKSIQFSSLIVCVLLPLVLFLTNCRKIDDKIDEVAGEFIEGIFVAPEGSELEFVLVNKDGEVPRSRATLSKKGTGGVVYDLNVGDYVTDVQQLDENNSAYTTSFPQDNWSSTTRGTITYNTNSITFTPDPNFSLYDGEAYTMYRKGTSGGGTGGGNGNGGGSGNVWQRYNSPKGYNTDLAIGGIAGEPANRVYMCEHPGSPTAGLYKGYINGETITWDAVHGLPSAKFYERNGVMRLWFSVGPEDDAGMYKKGTWTNTCGKLENSVKKVLIVFKPEEHSSISVSSVKIEGINYAINYYSNNSSIPNCETGKTFLVPSSSSNQDYYKVSITYGGEGVNGFYTKTEESILMKSDLNGSCTRLEATSKNTGRWVLLPI